MKSHFNKRNLLTVLLCLSSLFSMAQNVFTKFEHRDKFDDIVSSKYVKTLITKTDSVFVIETKGQKPVEYRYIDVPLFSAHIGSRDSLVNLVADVYGYEDQYKVFTNEDLSKVVAEVQKETEDLPDSLVFEDKMKMLFGMKLLEKIEEYPTISIRTISRYSFSYEYDTDLFWIKFPDGSRYIYHRK